MSFDWKVCKEPLLQWYRQHHRELEWRKTKDPYRVWVSEIMLQQTRVEAVKGYYARFMKELPDISFLSNVSEERLLKLWEGLGYYNRARNLKKAATVIMEEYNGIFPREYHDILSLPGIGEYTAGAICSICYDMPVPAVDGNVLRVVTRLMECYDNIDDGKTKRKMKEELVRLYEGGSCSDVTQALMELGAVVCVPNGMPRCEECPLKPFCEANKTDSYTKLPVRKEKKQRRIEEKTVFILHDGDKYAIRKRPNKGLLANLWEFYHVEGQMDSQAALDYISKEGFEPIELEKMIPYTHVFSHVEWHMVAYYVSCNNQRQNTVWVDFEEFQEEYALPTAFKFFIERER